MDQVLCIKAHAPWEVVIIIPILQMRKLRFKNPPRFNSITLCAHQM